MGATLCRSMTRDAKTVAGWDFDRIIPCHGVRFIFFRYFFGGALHVGNAYPRVPLCRVADV